MEREQSQPVIFILGASKGFIFQRWETLQMTLLGRERKKMETWMKIGSLRSLLEGQKATFSNQEWGQLWLKPILGKWGSQFLAHPLLGERIGNSNMGKAHHMASSTAQRCSWINGTGDQFSTGHQALCSAQLIVTIRHWLLSCDKTL